MVTKEVRSPATDELVAVHTFEVEPTTEAWEKIVKAYFPEPLPITQAIEEKYFKAKNFGRTLLDRFAKENMALGITQYGLTAYVLSVTKDIIASCDTGSLTLLPAQIDAIDLSNLPPNASIFLNQARLSAYKQEVITFLGTL